MSAARILSKQKSETTLIAAIAICLLVPAAFATGGTGWGETQSGAYLGVHAGDLTPEQAVSLKTGSNEGALILSIDQDGPACKAGLKANDVIVALNGKKVQNAGQLAEMMRNMQGGKAANLTVVRDGTRRDVKVTLGNRQEWMTAPRPPVANTFMAGSPTNVMPPVAYPGDVEVPVFTPASARRGLVVESLTAQLAEYFGVPPGQGVLVRNVQKGSVAANSGLKAGDVIVKINGEVIRDLADWRRSMGSLSGKSTFSIIRDKREQSFEMNLPAPSSRLDLGVEDWDEFGKNMDALNDELQRLGPELQRETQQAMMFRQDELDKMQRDVEKSMKHQSEEMEKSMKKLEPQLQKQGKEMQEQAEALRKEMEKMTPELLKQGMEIEKSVMPTQQDIEAMSRLAADQMKAVTPKIQQKMDEWRKKMEERERELQEQIRKQSDETGHPNHF
jgi:membrane-associated protease RseP (regulator of RpoE activity)